MRRAIGVVACALGALGLPGAAGGAETPPDYTKLIVVSGEQKVEATLLQYCHPQPDTQINCGTAALKPTGRVKLRADGRVDLLFAAPASHVYWQTTTADGRPTGSGQAFSRTKTFKRWRLRLPKRLSRSTRVLGFSVSYPYAWSLFQVGAQVRR